MGGGVLIYMCVYALIMVCDRDYACGCRVVYGQCACAVRAPVVVAAE